jgi:hypothetical protein
VFSQLVNAYGSSSKAASTEAGTVKLTSRSTPDLSHGRKVRTSADQALFPRVPLRLCAWCPWYHRSWATQIGPVRLPRRAHASGATAHRSQGPPTPTPTPSRHFQRGHRQCGRESNGGRSEAPTATLRTRSCVSSTTISIPTRPWGLYHPPIRTRCAGCLQLACATRHDCCFV